MSTCSTNLRGGGKWDVLSIYLSGAGFNIAYLMFSDFCISCTGRNYWKHNKIY